jgi:hypothetical protein
MADYGCSGGRPETDELPDAGGYCWIRQYVYVSRETGHVIGPPSDGSLPETRFCIPCESVAADRYDGGFPDPTPPMLFHRQRVEFQAPSQTPEDQFLSRAIWRAELEWEPASA